MNFLDDEKKKILLMGVIILLELIIISLLVVCDNCDDNNSESSNNNVALVESVVTDAVLEDEENTKVRVDIKGAVKKTGVYEIGSNSRITDVIEMAGGLKENASTKYLNLSKKVSDEMVIYVYTNNQVKNMEIIPVIKESCECPTEDIKECVGASAIIVGSSNSSISSNTTDNEKVGKVSINKGTKEELMTLSGIGESKADAIIQYRIDNNGFKTLEDIMNVSGIGEAAYNKIKDNITL